MDKINKKDNDLCSTYKDKLVELIDGDIPLDREPALRDHINNCEGCQSFLQTTDILKNRMSASPAKDLYPDPRIIKNIMAYQNIKKGLKTAKPISLWERIQEIFEYRIPIYQALGAILLLSIIFIYISNSTISPSRNALLIDYSNDGEGLTSSELYLADSLGMSEVHRGQNVKEDSVLMSFLVPTM